MDAGCRGRAAMPGTVDRPRSRRAVGRRAALWWIAPFWLAIALVPFTPALPAAALAPGETGKYYIVGPPVNGQREYLYSIALRTLGNGNRFREIIELNRGRKQPDGGTFTDGVELAPGWILVLPRDAKGPEVRTGPLPTFGPQPTRPSPSTVAPTPSRTASSPATATRPATDTATSGPAAGPATVAVNVPPGSARSGSGPFGPGLVRIGAGVLAVVFAVVALLVLRQRGYGTRAVTLDDGPWPPERHHTPTPAELAALAEDTSPPPPPGPSPAGAPVTPPSGPAAPTPPKPEPPVDTPPESSPGLPSPVGTDRSPEPPGPAAPEPPGATDGGGRTDTAGRRRPALPLDGDVPYVRVNVLTEVGPVLVRLAGVTTGPATPAYAWLGDDEPAPAAAVPLVLGREGPWRLHVDLSRTPDVFTLVGAMEDCRRLAARYARQLRGSGIEVGVVGDTLGDESVPGCRSLTGLPEPGDELPDPFVVITAGLPEGAGADLRELVAATSGRCVPMVIGPVPHGRWSAQLGSTR